MPQINVLLSVDLPMPMYPMAIHDEGTSMGLKYRLLTKLDTDP